MNRRISYLIMLLFMIATSFSPVYAEEVDRTFDITQLPQKLATVLNISETAGKLLASALFLLMFMLPVLFLTKSILPVLFVGFLTLGFLVVIGWLDGWIILLLALFAAIMVSDKFKDLIGG